jgi:hypothetical protein
MSSIDLSVKENRHLLTAENQPKMELGIREIFGNKWLDYGMRFPLIYPNFRKSMATSGGMSYFCAPLPLRSPASNLVKLLNELAYGCILSSCPEKSLPILAI